VNSFTPLKTYQGLSINELKTLINGRDLYIWGCGHLGRIMKRCFEKNGLVIKAFCDSNHRLHMNYIDNVKIIDPRDIFDVVILKKAFIIIASARYIHEMESACLDAGMQKKEHYLSYIQIARPEAAIDVAGKCNLKCPSCPRGNMERLHPEGFMSAAVYSHALDKLLKELPQIMCIELSTWGEPFMNPDLAEIIEMTEKYIPCSVSTNLQIPDQLESVIKAQPSQMIISASGYGESYEVNHAGGSWQIFYDNINYLRELIKKHSPKTEFAVSYHLYRNNKHEDLDKFRNLCSMLGFKLLTAWAYLNPYDKLLDYCEGRSIGMQAEKALNSLQWNLKCSLEMSKAEASNPCLCQRIFPIINWDLSVSLCHVFYNPVIVDDFLNTTLDDIIESRHKQLQCKKCQSHGLHRLDIDVLLKKYSANDILINN
jgi:MoaA/NifB/PqqE/SkfB family radical SAM enzyme